MGVKLKNKSNKENNNIRPFLKWAGNKYRVIDEIKKHIPAKGNRLVEPFAGSAAAFLNTDYNHYLISDTNPDLIHLYNFLKKEGASFIKKCRYYFASRFNDEDEYYRLRKKFNQTTDTHKRAILFVYLNRHGYNGLCRYNSKGGYNVPFGRYKKPYFPENEMLAFHEKSKKAIFKVASFEKTFNQLKKDDVIYCDPPYVPLSPSANFTSYSSGGFNNTQQIELANKAMQAAQKGMTVLVSNHKTDFTDEIYIKAKSLNYFTVRRYISCNGKKRQLAGEVLALFKK